MSFALQAIQAEVSRLSERNALPPIAAAEPLQPATPGLMDGFKQALQAVDEKDRQASDQIAAVDSGASDDMVGAMLASSDASLSFSMLMQVRNKVAGAFDELVKLPL
jgi:flagellar hook-basal body complex protein FliE